MPESSLVVLLLGLLVIPIHCLGVLLLRLQVWRLGDDDANEHSHEAQEKAAWGEWTWKLPAKIFAFARRQVHVPPTLQALQLVVFPKLKHEIFCSWVVSTSVLVHIIFGTLLLSSLRFAGTQDALQVVIRYTT